MADDLADASLSERVKVAVLALLTAARPDADVQRNNDKQSALKAEEVNMRDGSPGDPIDETLSPYKATFEHRIPVAIAVPRGTDSAASQLQLDAAVKAIAVAVRADPYLGGLCDWLETAAAESDALSVQGSRGGLWADFDIVATYTTDGANL